MSRRQSRKKQTTSYSVGDQYSFLDEDDENTAPSRRRRPAQDDDEDGDDFMPDTNAEEEPEDDFDEELIEEDSDGEVAESEEASAIGIQDVTVTPSRPSKGKGKSKPVMRVLPQTPAPKVTAAVQVPNSFAKSGGRKVNMDDDKLRNRGLADFSKSGGQELRLRDLFAPGNSDLTPILKTRDVWRPQETLPLHDGGCKRSYFESIEARAKDEKFMQTWYANTGRKDFTSGQKSSILSSEEGTRYMANDGADSLNVLMGTITKPKLHVCKRNTFVDVADAFEDKAGRRGWLLNLGSRIQDAQWMTNEEGSTQYLAVAVEQKDPDQQSSPMEQSTAPAFSATKSFAASIQIWAFESTKKHALDTSKEPRLALVICTNWGAPKQFRWSPIGPHDRAVPSDDQTADVALLAGIWSDGRVRVLNIEIPKTDTDFTETTFVHISQAAFDVSMPQTIPTCLQWLSGSSFAVGTAAGTMGIWTLTRPGTLSTTQPGGSSHRPWFYKQIGDTYVLTLLSGWPSNPQFISASTADGFARLYDIRSPEADTVASVRGRVLVVTQAWHEHTQSFIMPDEHYILKHNPIRRFIHNIYSARAESSIVRVAASPVHPGVLVGGANGTVFATNPVGRLVNTKVVPWQQNWFVHEWRPPLDQMVVKPPVQDTEMEDADAQEAAGPSASKVHASVLSEPMVRFTEGYKATQPGIAFSVTSKKKPENENSTLITIFEEQSAISALAWNPNLMFGTWAVAGMNSGLLRVEDIGV